MTRLTDQDDSQKHIEDARLKAVTELTIAQDAMALATGWLRAYTGSNEVQREKAAALVIDIRAILRKVDERPLDERYDPADYPVTPVISIVDEGLQAEGFTDGG
jgi:hypothetical protein